MTKRPNPPPVEKFAKPSAPPPDPKQTVIGGHEHRYVLLDTGKTSRSDAGYQIKYQRVDRFFCEVCLETKEIVREEWSSNGPPNWY